MSGKPERSISGEESGSRRDTAGSTRKSSNGRTKGSRTENGGRRGSRVGGSGKKRRGGQRNGRKRSRRQLQAKNGGSRKPHPSPRSVPQNGTGLPQLRSRSRTLTARSGRPAELRPWHISCSGLATVPASCQTDLQLLLTTLKLQTHPSCSTSREVVINSQKQEQLGAKPEALKPLEETLRVGHTLLLRWSMARQWRAHMRRPLSQPQA